MRRRLPNRAARTATLLTLVAALLLLCVGGTALQQTEAGAGERGGGDSVVAAGHAAIGGSHLPDLIEALDAKETFPVGYEHLNALSLGLFLISLGLLIGAGLVGRDGERRLLELLRLPSVIPLAPARAPLSALEVFRL